MLPQVNLSRWKPHLRAAARQGKSLTVYAAEHGLSRHTLYAAKQAMGARGAARGARSSAGRSVSTGFTAVKLLPAPEAPPTSPFSTARLIAHLPNGATVELTCGGSVSDLALTKTFLDSIAGAPCSASTRA
jgi:hypothetical protein